MDVEVDGAHRANEIGAQKRLLARLRIALQENFSAVAEQLPDLSAAEGDDAS